MNRRLLAPAFVAGAVLLGCTAWAVAPQAEDHGSAPRCTDAIADAGGICWGEPIAEGPSSASSNWRDGYVPCDTPSGNTMVVGCYWDKGDQPYVVTDDGETFMIDDATGQRTYVETGQEPWVEPAEGPSPVTLPTITLIPCPTEDSDNCYWDATQMGNGQGTSFVTLNGVTYYPEAK